MASDVATDPKTKIGVWWIGAWGHLATATVVRLAGDNGENSVVVGGHEIRRTSYMVEARSLSDSFVEINDVELAALEPTLIRFDRNVRTGTIAGAPRSTLERASTATIKLANEPPVAAIERIGFDLQEFTREHGLEHTIVVNVAPAESADVDSSLATMSWIELSRSLEQGTLLPLRASWIYAIAAIRCRCSYLDCNSSIGIGTVPLLELAEEFATLHGQCDLTNLEINSASARLMKVLTQAEQAWRNGRTGSLSLEACHRTTT
jgi:myo-inositol-1-phosphate synthase